MKERKKVAHKKLLNGHDPHFRNAYQRHEMHKQTNKQEWGLKEFFFLFLGRGEIKSNERAWKANIKSEQQKEHL